MEKVQYHREIEERYRVDLCVVGGGPSGMTAAIAAARQGLTVYLAESQGFFGGAATAALVPAFMPFNRGAGFMAGGLGREIYDHCLEHNFMGTSGELGSLGIHAEKYKKIMDDMVRAEENISFSFFTSLIDVQVEDGTVSHCIFSAKSGIFAVTAKVFVDGTGDGDLSAWAGAPFELGDKDSLPMPSTLCSIWENIDWTNKDFSDNEKMEEAIADGVFTQEDRHIPGIWKITDRLGGANISHSFGVDATDERSLTTGMLTGRDILPEYETYYRDYLGRGFKDSTIVISGSYLGIRESRRIMGDYIMTVDDFNNRARFNDEIGVFSYPVDIHIAQPTKEAFEAFHQEHTTMVYKPHEYYGIPYRIMLPLNLTNVLNVGRSVSTDRQMQSSIRVMPACFIMGQAAGIAAALAVKNNTTIREIDIATMQHKLKEMGGFLPEQ